MPDEIIRVEIEVNEKLDVDVHVSDVMYSVNRLPLLNKWNLVAGILTHLKLNGKDEDNDPVESEDVLTDEQVTIIKTFLEKQLAYLNK